MTGQACFYPQHCEMPRERPADEVRRLAANLTQALQFAIEKTVNRASRHVDALRQLVTIFGTTAADVMETFIAPPQSSNNPTIKQAVHEAPSMHNRVTRNNIPGRLPTIDNTTATLEGGPVVTSEGGQSATT